MTDPGKKKPWIKKQRRWGRRDGPFRFTVKQFYKLDDLGYFEDRKVELIRGIIHEMNQDPVHCFSHLAAGDIIRGIFRDGWVVSHFRPLDLGRKSLLLPDLYVVAGAIRDFSIAHPTTAALVVEISDATLNKDRTIKAHLYAQAGLADYWIVNLVDRRLEVLRNPGPDASRKGRFRYADVTIVAESGRIAPLAAPESFVNVADLLP